MIPVTTITDAREVLCAAQTVPVTRKGRPAVNLSVIALGCALDDYDAAPSDPAAAAAVLAANRLLEDLARHQASPAETGRLT